jgi:hypothetical protein
VHLSPASWLEQIVRRFLPGGTDDLDGFTLDTTLRHWLVIERAQMMAWWFAVGLLMALVTIVATRDVAFAWSTTLSVAPERFHALIEAIAWPWRAWLPSAVPSEALIEQSQYYRLGGALDTQMVHRAAALGAWWRFLAMATLTYAVMLRASVWGVARVGLRRTLERSLMSLPGVETLLMQMKTPLITTVSSETEPRFVPTQEGYARCARPDAVLDMAMGWAMKDAEIAVMLDALGVDAAAIERVGGVRTLEEDAAAIQRAAGNVLLLVKGWEPPTMDWVDFVSELTSVAHRVWIVPIGTPDQQHRASAADVAVWERKLTELNNPKVWLWRP